jgi:16S rRNA (uracil1498-N3)-methyltransferase
MHRVVIPPVGSREPTLTIREPQAVHHLVRVLRVKPGEPLECLDGEGRRYTGRVLRCAAREVVVQGAWGAEEPLPRLRLTLGQALIKPERFEWVIEKATELGAARILPMVAARSAAQPPASRTAARLLRWRRIAEAAAAQCGRSRLPVIEPPVLLAQVLDRLQDGPVLVFTLNDATIPFESALPRLRSADAAAVLIGPEGDFTSDEVALAGRAGGVAVRFGGAVLRSETAAIAALAILQHSAGML